MKFKNILHRIFFFTLIIMPFNVFAYSNYIVPGGDNVGIEVNTKEILVVGFYNVNGKNIASSAGFNLGDRIIKVNNENISSINDMVVKINKTVKNNSVIFTVKRDNYEKDITLNIFKDEDNVYKTGLYVKDKISGVGTLTYIDPETNIYGALGHEIIESNTGIKIDVRDGKIFKSDVTGINKSDNSNTGEKKAKLDESVIYGNIIENTKKGIFGKYSGKYEKNNLLKVGSPNDIKIGPAVIKTVLNKNEIKDYSINIIKINNESDSKNILFEITDKELISKTNGIIKGMSGSPIIQNNMIVGAVTHAIVNDSNKGYGIFITTMLKEGEN